MDVFEALGLDLPDTTRSMSVNDAADGDAELMQFLAPVFGWTDKEASANSLILFPGESQQDVGGLFEVPSVNGKQGEQAGTNTSAKAQPAPSAAKPSPFSGVTQFDLFLGDSPPAADAAGTFSVPAGADAADPFSSGAALTSPFAQPADIAMGDSQMQSQFSEGLLGLLEEGNDPTQQQHLPQPASGAQQQQQEQELQPEPAAMPQPPSLPQQNLVHPLAALPQLQQQQQPASIVELGLVNVSAGPADMPVPQLVPPPLPQLPLQQPQQPVVLPQQQMSLLLPGLQPQPVFQPLLSPLLTQAQQQQHLGQAPVPLRLPQLGQPLPLPLPVLQLSQQLLRQRQAAQQQQQAAQQLVSNQQLDADGPSDYDNRQYSSQPKRRGRPPKVPGQYSKGYEAIKRYREKKKGMVELMEAEIAQKREELHKLQAEQEVLRSRQLALESTMGNQDKLLAQMLQLKMSLAGRDDSQDTDLEATTAAAMAGVRQALAMQNGGDAGEAQALAAAAAAEQHQQLLLKKQQAQQKVLQEGPVFLRRYQGYVQAVADRLTQGMAGPAAGGDGGSNNGVEQQPVAGSFPTFPFTLIETLSLWQLSRLAILTRTDMIKEQGSSTEPWDDFTLNLSSGQHDLVPQDFWKAVAHQIGLHGEQLQQLHAAWRLYVSAMNRLNEERQGLLLKLQEAAAAEEAVLADVQLQQQQQQRQHQHQQPAGVGVNQDSPAGPSHSPGPTAAAGQAAAQLGQQAVGSSHSSPTSAQGTAAVAAGSSAAPINRRTGTAALDVAFVYMDLLDAVERNLLRGRAIIMMFGWSMLCMLTAEQIGRVCVTSWPYFPLMRAIVGYMLGKEDLVP